MSLATVKAIVESLFTWVGLVLLVSEISWIILKNCLRFVFVKLVLKNLNRTLVGFFNGIFK